MLGQVPVVLARHQNRCGNYYPFGLTMAGISSKAASFGGAENKYKYNGIELENDLEIQTYTAFFRELDPQTGRWWQVDPKTENMEMWSPYASNYDNPIRYSDPLGDEGQSCCWEEIKTIFTIAQTAVQTATTKTFETLGNNFEKRWEAGVTPPQILLNSHPAEILSMGGGGLLMGKNLAASEVNAAKALVNTEVKSASQVAKTVEKYEVGTAKDLSKMSVKDGLDIHHTPQSQPASQVIKGYDKSTAPAIALPQAEHKAIPTLKGTNTAGNARQQLAKDIKDLRNHTNAPNSSLQKLIELNKKLYPDVFKKN